MELVSKKHAELEWKEEMDEEAVKFTHPEIMAKFISSIDSNGYPHLSFITSNIALGPKMIKWGAFVYGLSKGNVLKNPKQGILYMTASMPFKFLQLKVKLDHISTDGADAEIFNKMALFRYNTYMRVHKIFFNEVVHARKVRNIPLLNIVKGMMSNLFGTGGKTGSQGNILETIGNRLYSGPIFPKFISYIDPEDGYPVIIPVFQARSVEKKRIVINFTQFKQDLLKIPPGSKVALIAMDFEMMTQVVKGTYTGIEKGKGIVDIEYVYNSMPPKNGQVYPVKEVLPKIEKFA